MKKLLALAVLAACSAGTAFAAGGPVYAGASVGHSHASGAPAAVTDAGGASLSVFGGYQLTPNLAAELGYAHLAHISAGGANLKPEMVTLQAVGTLPVTDKVTAFAKGGVAYTHINGDLHRSHYTPVVAIGASYALTKDVALQAEVAYVHDFAKSGTHLTNTSVGLKFAF